MYGFKARILGIIIPLVCSMGCGFQPPSPLNEPSEPPVFGFDAYKIGDIDGPLADEFHEKLQLVQHTGLEGHAPILIAADALQNLGDEQRAAILSAYEANYPILLVQADAAAVNDLHVLLGDSTYDFSLPEDMEYVEVHAVDRESDGSMWVWTSYPPATEVEETTLDTQYELDDEGFIIEGSAVESAPVTTTSFLADEDPAQDLRADGLVEWLDADGQRSEALPSVTAKERATLQAGGNELTNLAHAYNSSHRYQVGKTTVLVQYYVYSCHSKETEEDWFLIIQKLKCNSTNDYIYDTDLHRGLFVDSVTADTWLEGYDDDPAVELMDSSPENANNVTDVTSSVSVNVGGTITMNGPSISGGVTVSNSETVHVKDCEVINNSISRLARRLGGVPSLAKHFFAPVNQWIWKVSPAAGQPNMQHRITFAMREDSIEKRGIFYYDTHRKEIRGKVWSNSIPLQYPPTE
jgi:hypothetical protein